MRPVARLSAAAATLAAAALAFAACAGPASTQRVHPERLTEVPQCTACHERGETPPLDHGPGWVRGHADLARQNARTCELCHRASWCADCHGAGEEIKPSDKRATRPATAAPHRGDYIFQHRIDGRLDPASCFACHGRKNDWRCTKCHR